VVSLVGLFRRWSDAGYVFANGSDPVDIGLAASLSRPGGNVTGITFRLQELTAKRLEVLREAVPAANFIGLLVNPINPQVEADIKEAETAARILEVRLTILNASTRGEIEGAFKHLAGQRIGVLATNGDTGSAARVPDGGYPSLTACHCSSRSSPRPLSKAACCASRTGITRSMVCGRGSAQGAGLPVANLY